MSSERCNLNELLEPLSYPLKFENSSCGSILLNSVLIQNFHKLANPPVPTSTPPKHPKLYHLGKIFLTAKAVQSLKALF
jgi:hypothetical protein